VEEFYPKAPCSLTISEWPLYGRETINPLYENKSEVDEVDWAVQIATEARSLRGLLNISPALKIPLLFKGREEDWQSLENHLPWVCHLARLESIDYVSSAPKGTVPFVIGENTFSLKVDTLIDMDATYKLLSSKKETLLKEASHLQKKLENNAYKQAKPDQWAEDKDLLAGKQQESLRMAFILESW